MAKTVPEQPTKLTRPQHERIYALVRLIQERHFPNASTFMRELEVDRRTILRDLDYLRERMGLPIEYDASERGYYLSGPIKNMPLLEMCESDLLWLFVGQHLLQQAGNDELANQVRASFQRVSNLFGSTISVRWDQLATVLSAKTSGLGAAELQTFRAISEGLSRHLEVCFEYRKSAKAAVEQRQVQPLHSAFVNGQWYLFAYDLGRKATRAFVLSRMDQVKVTTQSFDPTGLPVIPELLQHGFGAKHSTDHPTLVKLKVSSEIAHLIEERRWHVSQKITHHDDGSITLELTVNTFRELTNWICSWGPNMEVLEPRALRQKVAKTLRDAAAVYQ